MHVAVAEETGSGMSSRGPNGNAEATIGTARPAGMPLGQWLNAKLAQPAPVPPAPPAPPAYAQPPQPYIPQQPPHMAQPAPMASAAADSLSDPPAARRHHAADRPDVATPCCNDRSAVRDRPRQS